MSTSKPTITALQAQSPLPPDLRNEIYSALLSGTSQRAIEATLDHEMQATGFTSTLKAYVTHLLRTGECATFDEVMARVEDKIRSDTKGGGGAQNGVNGSAVNGVNGSAANGHARDDEFDLKLPERVVAEGTKTVAGELEKVLDISVD